MVFRDLLRLLLSILPAWALAATAASPADTVIVTVPHLESVASHNVLLALPGEEYVAYFPRGGTNSVGLAAGNYVVEWLRAETGQYVPQPALNVADGAREFTPPNDTGADWVLHLKRKQTR